MDVLRIDPRSKSKQLEDPTYGTYLLLRYQLGIVVAKVCIAFLIG